MKIKLNTGPHLCKLSEVKIGDMFLYNCSVHKDDLTLFIKTKEIRAGANTCLEVGGDREFGFISSTAVYPVKSISVEY